MDSLSHAVDTIKKHPLEWVVFNILLVLANQLVVGWLLIPNALRVLRASVETGEAPKIGDYFKFDDLNDELGTMLILMLIYGICSLCCAFPLLIAFPLCFWAAHLAADGTFGALEAVKASFAHAKDSWLEIISTAIPVFAIIGLSLACCGLGVLLANVFALLCFDHLYQQHKSGIYQAAEAAGVQRRA